ncbi:hypothetical protein CANMA_003155 [Candida margitis]|uniref:uncharacterized protein n=1 Tax=Candida margitis TaxID=1775924 RepID=UPI00222762B8|nr:uncharacterized protein CANMA_003155 [Candida margitis]KAI5967335.1 hypothetical protein CANMA_003155 [Candida margitis]
MNIPQKLLRVGHTHRFYSSSIPDKNSIYVLSIPLTTSRSFIYCNHRPILIGKASKAPLISKIESRAVNIATKGWNKLASSKLTVNVKIVEWIRKLLATIPYEENCLRSFPNKEAMIREINEESLHLVKPVEKKDDSEGGGIVVNQSDIKQLNIPASQLKPIPLYHAQYQHPSIILDELVRFRSDNYKKHKKGAVLCAIGIPLSLPFALVPVVPNVPGFYLAYRLYCHVKALLGINHLDYLLDNNMASQHIRFTQLPQIDEAYGEQLGEDGADDTFERLLITPEIIDTLVTKLSLENNVKDDLTKALMQTKKRLKKNIKLDDQVE